MIAVVHLSDIHISSKNKIVEEKKAEIANTIYSKTVGCDYVFILTTGDIAATGQSDEYDLALSLYAEIDERFNNSTTPHSFLFVPGNHDCDFTGDQNDRDNIIDSNIELSATFLPIVGSVQNNYNNFVEILKDDKGVVTFKNPMLEVKSFNINSEIYRFILLNSAFFSKRRETKGKLKLPKALIEGITEQYKDENDIKIAALHHPLHWLIDDEYRDIRLLIEDNCNLIFTGHEHLAEAYTKETSRKMVAYHEGALLSNDNDIQSFSIIKFSRNEDKEILTLNWKGDCFTENKEIRKNVISKNGKRLTKVMEMFLDESELIPNIEKDIKLSSVFIPPHLMRVTDTNEKQRVDSKDLLENNFLDRYLILKAGTKYGKTSLLKMVYKNRYYQGKFPIFLNGSDLNTIKIKEPKDILNAAFEGQYENITKDFYDSIDKEKKVVVIDDIDNKLKPKEIARFIKFLKQTAQEVILSVSLSFSEISMLSELDRDDLEDAFKTWDIVPLNKSKQIDLFLKWEIANDRDGDVGAIEKLEEVISNHFKKGILPLTPFYLLSTLHLAKTGSVAGISPETGSAEFYRTLISYHLLQIGIKEEDLDGCLDYISQLAYEISLSDIKEINLNALNDFNQKYRDRKMLRYVPISMEQLIRARVFKETNDTYCFSYTYMYYFFVAKYIAFNLDREEVQKRLSSLFKNLSKKENANVIVFLAYHAPRQFVVNTILSISKEVRENLEGYNLLENDPWKDVSFIDDLIEELPQLQLESKTGMALKKEEAEKRDAFDQKQGDSSEEDDEGNSLLEALRLSEIGGCLLRNHSIALDAEPKRALYKEAHLLHKAIMQIHLSFIKKEKEHLLILLEKEIEKISAGKVTPEKISRISRNIVFYFASLVYFNAAIYLKQHTHNKKLDLIHNELRKDDDLKSPFMEIMNFYGELAQEQFPLQTLRELVSGLDEKRNSLFFMIPRLFAIRHISLYYDKLGQSTRDTACKLLKISDRQRKQLLLDSKK